MKPLHAFALTSLAALLAACPPTPSPEATPAPTPEATPEATPAPVADPCALLAAPASTPEETAWRLFVAASCPTGAPAGSPQLAFETWMEQSCLANPSQAGCTPADAPTVRTLHASVLRRGNTPQESPPLGTLCNPMTTKGEVPSLDAFVPSNLSATPTFCEEVFVNEVEAAYVKAPAPGQTLTTLTGQAAYMNGGNAIAFPTPSLEIKADWMPASSLSTPFIDCATPPQGLFVEEIGGVCYALVGVHLSSKLYPNWGWSTFEPQIAETNPNRCDAALYGECSDAWGASPATNGRGTKTTLTPAAAALIKGAKLPAAFANYRLTGTQIDYSVPELGNSFVEFNAQVPPHEASCITCHFYAQLDPSTTPPTENPNFGAFPGDPAIGQPAPLKAPWVSQDFSWMLATMPKE